jgi:RNA-splicing ligase RtcB
MEKGLVIGTGKGNADWNQSAPHGAGRKMGRGVAKRTLSLDEFETRMRAAGVWSSCVGKDTLDEAPMAYKSADSIRDAIGDTVEIEKTLKPVYNFKAC